MKTYVIIPNRKYVASCYWKPISTKFLPGGRQRASIEFQRFSTNMVEQHQKRLSNKESVLLQKKLRSYAGHGPPLFRTSGKVQTKSFRTFVLKGYLQSPLSTVQTSINLLLKIKRNRDWKWISNIEICLTGIVASSDYCWLLTQRSLNPIPNIWPWHGLWLCNRACIHIV